METTLDIEDRQLVRDSFAQAAADGGAAAACFYRHLFDIDPALRNLFVERMDRQGQKLAETLAFVVAEQDRLGALRIALEQLALRHLAYGVAAKDYDSVGAAILAMLAERLGTGFTPRIEMAWRRLYTRISEIMLAAAYPTAIEDAEPS